uniref:NADH dehydrogenase subunit 4L n=1 Tax=Eudiplozoon nipponicum TaxID=116851 RepID=UPI001F145FEA|nr:NADH dehydrogenase subunit 4L [Eudiplozoon nipponicum]UKQ56154.1 NADH dehydrogenase subunit 4L [Eudiplozoon nipponicum]WET59141.1 NADH dehydrogenase subunit 4l [Eudiplozoon nipponicum]WET59153.1 NADH dehydrogenase subunit 4l [Eudiplozoon nipponicum]WET59165.1 NADH dehydrogenase subunit 4l [Eudiplozoon nipponicum]WET59177.1 NADH dehydrogenase subunit 4l [Eudiplozoon nipponicum]
MIEMLFFLLPLLVGFIFVFNSFLNVLIVLENFNLLLLFSVAYFLLSFGGGVNFIFVLCILTIEVLFGLVLINSIWCLNSIYDVFII